MIAFFVAAIASARFVFAGPIVPYVFLDQPGGELLDGPGGVSVFSHDVQDVNMPIFARLVVTLDLSHTWAGDLVITLEHNGVEVTLLDRLGVPESQFGNSANFDGVYMFQSGLSSWSPYDVAGSDTDSVIPGGGYDVNNTDGSTLDEFHSMSSLGLWTLTITDGAFADSGTLRNWRLNILPAPGATSVAAVGASICGLRRRRSVLA